MEEGWLDPAPVCTDVREFDGRPWRGLVDCVAGGFPCQDVSLAGRREGIVPGNRSGLWHEFARVVREVEPRLVFVENVAGLLTAGRGESFAAVLGALAEMGYDAAWGVFSAADVGASHLRERVFILAERGTVADPDPGGGPPGQRVDGVRGAPHGEGPRPDHVVAVPSLGEGHGGPVADPHGRGPGSPEPRQLREEPDAPRGGEDVGLPDFPPVPGDLDGWVRIPPDLWPSETEPSVRGVADGAARGLDGCGKPPRVDRLRALGNGVVPAQAGLAFRTLEGILRMKGEH